MAIGGRANATGRSSGIMAGRQGKLGKPPKGESWIWLTRDLLASPAMRHRSLYARMVLDFLMVEHTAHAGQCNGRLMATYDQLQQAGVPRRHINAAIFELENLGLVAVTRRGGRDSPSLYRLTWQAADEKGPTNEWAGVTEDVAIQIGVDCKRLRKRNKEGPGARNKNGPPSPFRVPPLDTNPEPPLETYTSDPRGNRKARLAAPPLATPLIFAVDGSARKRKTA